MKIKDVLLNMILVAVSLAALILAQVLSKIIFGYPLHMVSAALFAVVSLIEDFATRINELLIGTYGFIDEASQSWWFGFACVLLCVSLSFYLCRRLLSVEYTDQVQVNAKNILQNAAILLAATWVWSFSIGRVVAGVASSQRGGE